MNPQTLGEFGLSPLTGSASVAHVPAEAREQLAARFAAYTSPWHQAQILECRGGQGTQLSHLVAPVLRAAFCLTVPAIPVCPRVPSRQSIICQASSRLLDGVLRCVGARGSIACKAGPPHVVALAWRDHARASRGGEPRQRQTLSHPGLLHVKPVVLRPHVGQCSDLKKIAMSDTGPNGLLPREQSARQPRWRVLQPVRDLRLPCQRKLTEGIGKPSPEGNRVKIGTLCALAFIAAGCGPVRPKRLAQRMVPLSLVSPGLEQKTCWYETGSKEGSSPLQGVGMTDSGVSVAADHGTPSLQTKCRHRLEGVGHADAAIEIPTASVSSKTRCRRPDGLIWCRDDEEG